MSLSRIVMRLARNPGTEFADGDDHRGYTLTAPLTEDGHIDEAAFKAARERCTVRRFAPDEDAQMGRLAEKVKTEIISMGEALMDGKIPARPVDSPDYPACAYCDYKPLCGFEDGDPVREIAKMDREEVLGFLIAGDEQNG